MGQLPGAGGKGPGGSGDNRAIVAHSGLFFSCARPGRAGGAGGQWLRCQRFRGEAWSPLGLVVTGVVPAGHRCPQKGWVAAVGPASWAGGEVQEGRWDGGCALRAQNLQKTPSAPGATAVPSCVPKAVSPLPPLVLLVAVGRLQSLPGFSSWHEVQQELRFPWASPHFLASSSLRSSPAAAWPRAAPEHHGVPRGPLWLRGL